MAAFEVSTPSPPRRVHTPQSPKYGYSDSWEPYSPRKSARLSSRQINSNRTPSPQSSFSRKHLSSRKISGPLSTPVPSPMKKRTPATDSTRRASGTLTAESAASAADQLGIASPTSAPRDSMLPTPAKTPRKQPDEKTEAGVRSIARSLFPASVSDPEITSSARKRKPKKYTGMTMESFTAEDVVEPIQIFTDSRDRVPAVDKSDENPFYDATPQTEPAKRRSLRRKTVVIPGEGRVDVADAIVRDDGMIYVFRGKKIWKPAAHGSPSGEEEMDGEDEMNEVGESHRVTRSSIKPRLLFPPEQPTKEISQGDEDEEAATDIEDNATRRLKTTPNETTAPGTPAAPRFAPASPPTTARTTRIAKDDHSPMKKPSKARSPFDGWRRSKSVSSQGTKREGEALTTEVSSKRQRA